MSVDGRSEQTGSLLGRLARGVGRATVVTFEQVVVAALVFTLMATWKSGRRILGERLRGSFIPLPLFLEDVAANPASA